AAFEGEFAAQHRVAHAIAVTSCTTGLHLAMVALGVGPGDEVIVPAFTWVATANVVLHCGAKPVFVDISEETFNLDPQCIQQAITQHTKAIIPVHLFGLCADIDAIKAVIPQDIKIIEDAACAVGASYKSRMSGSLGDVASFSFHPRKIITTGEGGMVTTNDDDLANLMITMRNHGASISEEQRHQGPKPYLLPEFEVMGFNYRMTDLQGAVGSAQLQKLDDLLFERRRWAQYFQEELRDIHWLNCPQSSPEYQHSWQSFVTFVNPEDAPMARNDMMEWLQSKGVSTRPGTHAIHTQAYYQTRYGTKPNDFPHAWRCQEQSMAIPLHNRMSAEDFAYVVNCLKKLGN
ncbi:MAG: DegT/DnrJ/EryC1/StrS family aminotransferase, partial [Pseudomonadales bacterium]|nr:DegT/DnrJ/EryC1/StrS family aminotransferase [Pseudomonadales bacterium]